MSKIEKYIVLALLIGGALTHFVGLNQPDQVIFDEVHFGKFVTAYCCTHERFFDIHPPHVKLMMALIGWLGGYRGGFDFEYIGEPYGNVPITALRLVPALAGVLLPLVIFWLLRQLGASVTTAAVGGALLLFDNALTVQTRLISLDGVLLLTTFGAISAFLRALAPQTKHRLWWCVATGALCGLAVGSKFTGLAAPALVGVVGIVAWVRKQTPGTFWQWLGRAALLLGTLVIVYFGGWAIHFALLTKPGTGDAFGVPGPILDPNPIKMLSQFFHETFVLQRTMLSANYNLTATHPDMSPWWSWPLMTRTVFYWTNTDGQQLIYFLGNPVVWWGSTCLFILSVLGGLVNISQGKPLVHPKWWIPVLGYAIAMVPLMRVPRALFLYHYLTPLVFAILTGLLWLDQQPWWQAPKPGNRFTVPVIVVALVFVGFVWFSPLTYGLVSPFPQALLFWLPTWR